jgi:hypothetical protein
LKRTFVTHSFKEEWDMPGHAGPLERTLRSAAGSERRGHLNKSVKWLSRERMGEVG